MKADQIHNRQRSKKGSGRPDIKSGIKSYMENVSIDVFGYEKKVSKSISGYLEQLASEEKLPAGQLFIRIKNSSTTIRVFLHHQSKLIREIPSGQLVEILVGKTFSEMPGNRENVIEKVSSYLNEFSIEHNINEQDINVLISASGNKIQLEAFENQMKIRDIQLKDLIKRFK